MTKTLFSCYTWTVWKQEQFLLVQKFFMEVGRSLRKKWHVNGQKIYHIHLLSHMQPSRYSFPWMEFCLWATPRELLRSCIHPPCDHSASLLHLEEGLGWITVSDHKGKIRHRWIFYGNRNKKLLNQGKKSTSGAIHLKVPASIVILPDISTLASPKSASLICFLSSVRSRLPGTNIKGLYEKQIFSYFWSALQDKDTRASSNQ